MCESVATCQLDGPSGHHDVVAAARAPFDTWGVNQPQLRECFVICKLPKPGLKFTWVHLRRAPIPLPPVTQPPRLDGFLSGPCKSPGYIASARGLMFLTTSHHGQHLCLKFCWTCGDVHAAWLAMHMHRSEPCSNFCAGDDRATDKRCRECKLMHCRTDDQVPAAIRPGIP